MKNNHLGIIIVNWNSKEMVVECLSSMKKCDYIHLVIVIDNASSDESFNLIKKRFPNIEIFRRKENIGFARANNVGIKYFLNKGKKFILLLNPDTIVTSGSIEKLSEALQSEKNYGIAGPKIYSGKNIVWSCGGIIDKKRFSGGLIGYREKDRGQYNQMKEVDYIPGTVMMVKAEVFEKVGMLAPVYFQYYEDTEFCIRARKAGFASVVVPDAHIFHKASSSIGENSPAHQYYMARNHLLFVERNAPAYVKLREFMRFPKTFAEHQQKNEIAAIVGITDYLLRRFGKREYIS